MGFLLSLSYSLQINLPRFFLPLFNEFCWPFSCWFLPDCCWLEQPNLSVVCLSLCQFVRPSYRPCMSPDGQVFVHELSRRSGCRSCVCMCVCCWSRRSTTKQNSAKGVRFLLILLLFPFAREGRRPVCENVFLDLAYVIAILFYLFCWFLFGRSSGIYSLPFAVCVFSIVCFFVLFG